MRARRGVLLLAVSTVLVGAAAQVVTNYVTQGSPPSWLADPVRNWLVLGLLVAALVIFALLTTRAPEANPPPDRPLRFGTGSASLRPPSVTTPVRGRDRELATVKDALARAGGPFVVVWAVGGMGKTTLAAEAAERARLAGFAVYWIRWRTLEQLTGQMLEVAAALGMPDGRIAAAQQTGASLPDLVWEHLALVPGWCPGAARHCSGRRWPGRRRGVVDSARWAAAGAACGRRGVGRADQPLPDLRQLRGRPGG